MHHNPLFFNELGLLTLVAVLMLANSLYNV